MDGKGWGPRDLTLFEKLTAELKRWREPLRQAAGLAFIVGLPSLVTVSIASLRYEVVGGGSSNNLSEALYIGFQVGGVVFVVALIVIAAWNIYRPRRAK